mgnify:CR=1 FL=1
MSNRLYGKTLTADLSQVKDPESKKRINDFLEASNVEAIPVQEFSRRTQLLTESDIDYINQHSNLSEIVGHLRTTAAGKIGELFTELFKAALEPRMAVDRKTIEQLVEQEKTRMRDFTAKCYETGHFVSSIAAADFAEQLIGFMESDPRKATPEPHKLAAVH